MTKTCMLQDSPYSAELAVSHVAEIGQDILEDGEKNLHGRMQTFMYSPCLCFE